MATDGVVKTPSDVWLARAAWVVVLLACLQVLLFGYGRDQGIYAVVGDAILAGKMPYLDAWDFKPPGIFFVYAAAQALFGKAMVSVRIVEVAGLLAVVVAFRRLGRSLFDSPTAGLLGGALATLIHAELEFWHTAQPESFGGMLTVFALVLTTGAAVDAATRRRRALAWIATGLLFGAAFLFKPPLGGGAVACSLYVAWKELGRSRRAWTATVPILTMAVASFVPLAGCAAWFWLRGAWPELRWTLFEFAPGYTALGWHGAPLSLFRYGFVEALTGFSYLLPVALACAVALPPRAARQWEGFALILGIVTIHVIGIALQAKFFQYHYGATLPLLSFVAGLGLYKAWRFSTRAPMVGPAAFATVVIVLAASRVALRQNPGTFWERSADRMRFLVTRSPSREALDAELYHVVDYALDTDRRTARAVDGLTQSTDSIFVWGFEPAIYWFSGRALASRYLYSVPQRAPWQRAHARAELLSDLRRTRPAVLVVQHNDVFSFVTGDDLDSHAALRTFPPLYDMVLRKYRFARSVDDMDVYVRR